MELLKQYKEQYEEFTKIDDFNLEQRAKRVPAEKHFWVARLIDAKIEKEKLLKSKKKLKNTIIKKMMDDSPVKLDKKLLDKIDDTDHFEEINDKIKENEILTEYLELVVKAVSYIAQDIKNIVDLKTLEQL